MPDTNQGQLSRDASERRGRTTLPEEQRLKEDASVKALQDSEKRYRRLFESAQDGILILDAATGKVVDANPFLLNLLGYSYAGVYGQPIWELGVFKDIAASKDAFKTLQDTEYVRYDDLPLEALDGRPIAVEFVSNVYLVDGVKVIQCNIRDITQRKRAEKALGESVAKTSSILDNISIGVALISPEMEIVELNRQMREWFPAVEPGQRPICYRAFNDPPREAVCDYCPTHKTLRDGLVHEAMTCTPRAGGARSYRIVSSAILDASGKVTAAIEMVEDLTEKLLLESQVRQSQKMEAVGRLAGGVAHDFNNMLSVIQGYTDLALETVDAAQPLHADLEEISSAASRSTDIVRQLLTFARKQTIDPKVLDLNDTVEGMLKMLRRLIGEDVDLAWLPESSLWPVKMDTSQLEQILANVCVNARDAIAGVGKITIETHNVAIDAAYCAGRVDRVPGHYAMLSISDDGCGMDEETLDKIFEPFFTTKAVGQGTGLGLSTVYGIVKQNNGFIDVSSEEGKGATFRIHLAREAGEVADTGKERERDLPLSRGETVLVVEDEASVLELATRMLNGLGYAVLSAGAPGDATRLAEGHEGEIHLLLVDVILPGMNGRDFAKQIRTTRPAMKCLFMSGYTADVIANRGMLDEGAAFIAKPFAKWDLAAKVRAVLAAGE